MIIDSRISIFYCMHNEIKTETDSLLLHHSYELQIAFLLFYMFSTLINNTEFEFYVFCMIYCCSFPWRWIKTEIEIIITIICFVLSSLQFSIHLKHATFLLSKTICHFLIKRRKNDIVSNIWYPKLLL